MDAIVLAWVVHSFWSCVLHSFKCTMCIPFLLFYVCFSCFHFFGDSFTNFCRRAVIFVCNLIWHSSFTVCTSERVTMELADRTIGLLLTVTSLSIFTYYTFWVIILVSSFSLCLTRYSDHWPVRPMLSYGGLIYAFCLSAIGWYWSFCAQIFSTSRVCNSYSRICWNGTHLLAEHVYWICDAPVQKEEGMIQPC